MTFNFASFLGFGSLNIKHINRFFKTWARLEKYYINIKSKKCYKCKKEITLINLILQNLDYIPMSILKVWNFNFVHFLCCSCYIEVRDFNICSIS